MATPYDLTDMFPRASKSFIAANAGLCDAKPQRDKAPALGGAIQGKTESVSRTSIRFIGYRVRPLDPDNFAGGCKDLLDGLRHAGLIHGDEPWKIDFQTRQEKVAHYKDQKTVIEITYPEAAGLSGRSAGRKGKN